MTIEYIRKVLAQYAPEPVTVPELPGIRSASVLIPLVEREGELNVLLTARTHEVETHKGQISYPGGMRDPEDADAVETALRETEEEIGLQRTYVEVLGTIDTLLTPTKFLITPVVGYIATLPELSLNAAEVAEAFFVPLSFFADNRNGRTEERIVHGKTVTVWFYDYGNHLIWGATTRMIKQLLEILSKQGSHR